MADLFFYEAFEEEAEAIKRYLPSHLDAGFTWKTIQEEGHDAPPAPLLSIRTQSGIPDTWAGRFESLLTRSTGYDHVRSFLDRTGAEPACGYLPLYCHRAVAEQTLLMWLALLRLLPRQVEQFQRFERDGLTGAECQGKTLAVVGVGNIGSEVVKVGQAMEMEVLGVDIVERHDFVDYVTIDEALARADVVVCAMNLTQENRGYFDYARLKQARAGAIFVNIARGEMSPSRDLLRLLDEGILAGVGLDVFNEEKDLAMALRGGFAEEVKGDAGAALALGERRNVILTPHNAFNTRESVERKAEQSVQQAIHFLEHGRFLWPVPNE
ncbi:MAG: NAD(P)-dependent oxidoreductase [Planctomycetota bacterium]